MTGKLIAVVGATASGKSALALELAERVDGEIVNADSRQLYRAMDIGTAKPSPDDFARVPHHLYDVAEPRDRYSLALYQRAVPPVLDDIWARGKTPILVGGTGQYVWGLLEAWTVPEVPPDDELRARLQAEADEHGEEALHARLAAVDPESAGKIDRRNVRRVIRALEVYEHTGRPISELQTKGDPTFDFTILGVQMAHEEVVTRINKRVEWMYEEGIVLETRALLDEGVPPHASALSSIGYSEAVRYLQRDLKRDKAIELTKRATKKLARRQAQWFRAEDPRITWVSGIETAAAHARAFLSHWGEETSARRC